MKRLLNVLKRKKVIVSMAALLCLLCFLPGIDIEASNEWNPYCGFCFANEKVLSWSYYNPKKVSNKRTMVSVHAFENYKYSMGDKGWSLKKARIISSENAVVKASIVDIIEGVKADLELKKPGTAKLTFIGEFKKGKKTKTYRQTVTVKSVSYENPIKSLKINGREYSSRYKYFCSTTGFGTKESRTFSVKLKKNQKKASVRFALNKNWKVEKATVNSVKTTKKSMTVKNNSGIELVLKNTKTGITETVQFAIGNYEWDY